MGLGSTNAVGSAVFEGCVQAPEACASLLAGEPLDGETSRCGEEVCGESDGFSMTSVDPEFGDPMFLFVCE